MVLKNSSISLVNTQNLNYPKNDRGIFMNLLALHFKRLTASQFRYKNLPDGIKSWYIERGLWERGIVGFVKQENTIDDKYMVLFLAGHTKINFNGEITEANLTGYQTGGSIIRQNIVDDESGVFMKNNIENTPTLVLIWKHIIKMADIWFSDTNNLLLSNRKLIIKGKPEHFNTLLADLRARLNTESPALFIDEDAKGYGQWSEDDINKFILPVISNYEPQKYLNHYKEIRTQILDILGINHSGSHKPERNITDEVLLDTNENKMINEEMFMFRKEAVERLNETFGLNVSVEKLQQVENEEQEETDDEGETDDEQ